MNTQTKTLRINLSGSGTREEIILSLQSMADTVMNLSDEEIEKGGDLEDATLAGEYDEIDIISLEE